MLLKPDGSPFPASALTPRASTPWMATQRDPMRGDLWTFAEDTRQMLTRQSRTVLMLKSRTLVENFGPAKALQHLARLVGALKPQARSGDAAWDKLAEESFNALAYSPRVFDAGGRWTFETFQTFATYARYRDGDGFAILTETASGTARVAVREGHMVANPATSEAGWLDGVRTDANGFPLAYAFRAMGPQKMRILPFQNVHHFATWNTEGGTRGPAALAHCINDLHDWIETKKFFKHAIKTASAMGLSPKSAGRPGNLPSAAGIAAGLNHDSFGPPDDPVTGETNPARRVAVEDVLSGGIVAAEPYEVLADSRPHPNVVAFRDLLLKEAAMGLGVPPRIMYFLGEAGGAEMRVDLDIFAKFLLDQYVNHSIPFAQRFWTYFCAKEMLAGRLPYPSRGEFWKVRWTLPKSLTADQGKMGRLTIELRKTLLRSYASHYEELGLHWEDEVEQCAAESAKLIELETKYNLPPGHLLNTLLPSNVTAAPVEMPAAA